MAYDQIRTTFDPAQVLTDTTLIGSELGLAVFHGKLSVAWMGTNHRLNGERYDPADPTHLVNKVTFA